MGNASSKNQIRIGAFHDLPPDEFSSQISDEKKRKALFVQQCRETKTKTKGWDVSEVLKKTYANITKRNKGKHDTKDITEEGFRKRAKMISNIIDHASNHDQGAEMGWDPSPWTWRT